MSFLSSYKKTLLILSVIIGIQFLVILYFLSPLHTQFLPSNISSSDSTFKAENFEQIQFIRRFAEPLFTYDSKNFRQTQTALAFLMAEPLRSERLSDIHRLRSSIEERMFSQKSQIQQIQLDPKKRRFHLLLQVESQDGNTQESYDLSISLTLKATAKSAENPWGYLVDSLKIPSESQAPFTKIGVNAHFPSTLRLPCVAEEISLAKNSHFLVHFSNLSVTELQIFKKQGLKEPQVEEKISIRCRDKLYEFNLIETDNLALLYFDAPESYGKAPKSPLKSKIKSTYGKTLEEELGFVIESEE